MKTLSASQVFHYQQDGFLKCPNIFSREILTSIIDKAESLRLDKGLVFPENMRCRFKELRSNKEAYLEAFDPISDKIPEVAELLEDPFLKGALKDLYGEPGHCLKDKLLFKPPGGEGYSLHQDYISWDEFPASCIIILIALDPSGEKEGGLEVFPGRHVDGFLGPSTGSYVTLPDEMFSETQSEFIELQPGDVLFFSCMLPHRSGLNRSNNERRHLYLSYNADSDGGDLRDRYYDLFKKWYKELHEPASVFV